MINKKNLCSFNSQLITDLILSRRLQFCQLASAFARIGGGQSREMFNIFNYRVSIFPTGNILRLLGRVERL